MCITYSSQDQSKPKASKMLQSLHRLQSLVGMDEGPKSPRPPMLHIFLIITFGLVMKTVDSTTDIWTVINLYINNHPKWSLLLLIPVLLNTFITAFAWAYIENPRVNGWKAWRSFPLIFLQLYPQYRALRLILIGFGKWGLSTMADENAYEKAKKQYDDTIANLEGLFESIPELFCLSYFIIYLVVSGWSVVDNTRSALKVDICSSCLGNTIPPYSEGLQNLELDCTTLKRTEEQEVDRALKKCINTYYDEVISYDLMAKISLEDFNDISTYKNDASGTPIPQNILNALQKLWNNTDKTDTASNIIPERESKFRAFQSYLFFIDRGVFLCFTFVISFLSASYVLTKASLSGPGFSDETNNVTLFSKGMIFLLNMVFLWHKIIASSYICANIQNHEEKLQYFLLLLVLMLPHLLFGAFSLFVHVELKKGGIKVNHKVRDIFKALRGYPFLLVVPCLSPIVLHLSDIEEEGGPKEVQDNCEEFVFSSDKKDGHHKHNPCLVTIVCNLQSVVNAILHFGVLIPCVVVAGQDQKDGVLKDSVGFLYFYQIILAAIILALIGLIALLQRRETVM